MPQARQELLSIVMPVYREGVHLAEVLGSVHSEVTKTGTAFELVLVDDGSPDNTWQVIEERAAVYPMLRAARLSRNFGKEAALNAGLEMARGDVVIVMDADGQHPPSLLPEMIERWREGDVDIVEAVKSSRGQETLFNKFSAGVFYLMWNKLSGFELRNASDYKLLNRRAVDAYLQMRERNLFFRGMTAWLGFRRAQIPFEVADRVGGRTSWSLFRLVRLAVTGITSFSSLPLQVVSIGGFLFLLFALILGVQTLYVYLTGHAQTGFATVILLQLIIGGLLMVSLGTIGEYIARIYDEVKGRPRYLIGQMIEARDLTTIESNDEGRRAAVEV